MRNHIMLAAVFPVLSLVSCVYVVKDNQFIMHPIPEPKTISCDPMVMPVFKPLPAVPVLTAAQAANRGVSDTILVNKIKELGDYAKEMRQQMQEAQTKHLATCRH